MTAFAHIPRPGCVVQEGSWTHVIARKGDRGAGDPPNIRRAGLDGWKNPIPHGAMSRIGLNAKWADNCLGKMTGDWLNAFELHAVPKKGEAHRAGPLKITLERSSDGRTYLRAWEAKWMGPHRLLNQMVYEPKEYRIVVTHRTGLISWLFVHIDGKLFASSLGFGYGDRPLYPCCRIYCNERDEPVMDAWYRVEGY